MRGDEAWRWVRWWLHHLNEVATTPDSSDRMLKFTRTSSAGQPCQKWAIGKLWLRTGILGAVPLNHRALETISGVTQPLCHILLKAVGKAKLLYQIHTVVFTKVWKDCLTVSARCLVKMLFQDAESQVLWFSQYYGDGKDNAAGSLTSTMSACSRYCIYIN